jgi:TatD DNase family protein
VKEFIRSAVRALPDVAASAVALPGLSENACRAVSEELGARFRWRPYDRLGRLEGASAATRPGD